MPIPWTFDPVVLLGLGLLLGGYLYAIGPLRQRRALGDAVPPKRIAAFVAGWAVLLLSLVSPLDALGRHFLFLAHTTQLLLITTVAAPLLLLGVPEWAVWRILPRRAWRDATRGLSFWVLAVVGFNAIILVWHSGPLYGAALRSTPLHNLQNLCFLFAGMLTWWPLLTPLDRHTRLAAPSQMLYLVVESLPLDVFGAFALFTTTVFYPTYQHAHRVWGISAIVDQQVGGALLAVPGNLIDIVLMSVIFFAWIERTERTQRAREQADAERETLGQEAPAAASESQ